MMCMQGLLFAKATPCVVCAICVRKRSPCDVLPIPQGRALPISGEKAVTDREWPYLGHLAYSYAYFTYGLNRPHNEKRGPV